MSAITQFPPTSPIAIPPRTAGPTTVRYTHGSAPNILEERTTSLQVPVLTYIYLRRGICSTVVQRTAWKVGRIFGLRHLGGADERCIGQYYTPVASYVTVGGSLSKQFKDAILRLDWITGVTDQAPWPVKYQLEEDDDEKCPADLWDKIKKARREVMAVDWEL